MLNLNLFSLNFCSFNWYLRHYFVTVWYNYLLLLDLLVLRIIVFFRRVRRWMIRILNREDWISPQICIHNLVFELVRLLTSSVNNTQRHPSQTGLSSHPCIERNSACVCSSAHRFLKFLWRKRVLCREKRCIFVSICTPWRCSYVDFGNIVWWTRYLGCSWSVRRNWFLVCVISWRLSRFQSF